MGWLIALVVLVVLEIAAFIGLWLLSRKYQAIRAAGVARLNESRAELEELLRMMSEEIGLSPGDIERK